MRRLATLCFPALLCPISAPAMAANDGVIVFVPPETSAAQSASAQPAPASVPAPAPTRGRYGAGFIEALLTGGGGPSAVSNASEPADMEGEPEPQFRRQEVDYTGSEAPGTIVVDTPDRFLFLVEPHGKALRYGIGVGRPVSNGRASSGSAASRSGRTGRRRRRCCCAVQTCRAIWRAAPIIRSAREPSISGPRSTAFTAPTSRRPSATTSLQVAFG
jgi:lipoprotein-anchoring transpeptidase ErfK/SrfK